MPSNCARRPSCDLSVDWSYDRARTDAAIAEGLVDAVAFGTPFIANPDLVERIGLRSHESRRDSLSDIGREARYDDASCDAALALLTNTNDLGFVFVRVDFFPGSPVDDLLSVGDIHDCGFLLILDEGHAFKLALFAAHYFGEYRWFACVGALFLLDKVTLVDSFHESASYVVNQCRILRRLIGQRAGTGPYRLLPCDVVLCLDGPGQGCLT